MRKLLHRNIADVFRSRLIGTLDPLIGLAYPQSCSICDSRIEKHCFGSVCRNCWGSTPLFSLDSPLCVKCGRLITGDRAGSDLNCRQCSDHFYDKAIAVGNYSGALKQAILSLKSVATIPQHLNDLIAARYHDLGPIPTDLVIPVPLSERRQLERGFNQALLIAEQVGKLLNVDVDYLSLVRVKHSPMHRAGMDRKARAKTVAKAFAVQRPRLIEGKRILLVDDVLTSGSTASACAKELKSNGAISVSLFTVGRA